MKQTSVSYGLLGSPRRLSVAQAKAHLSAVLRELGSGRTIIHNRGRDVAVLLPMADYEMLGANAPGRGVARLLADIEVLKQRLGGGVDAFEPPRASLRAHAARLDARRGR